MRRFILITLALLALAAPALAQPSRFGEVAQALYATAHLTAASSDDAKRTVTIQLAEQMAFEFPGQGWGAKAAGNGRPISKDCVAKVDQVNGTAIVKGVCYDWIKGGGGVQLPPLANDVAGQVFVPVAAVDHLAVSTPPPPPPTTAGVTQPQLDAAISELHTTLWNEVESQLGAVRDLGLQTASRVSALELAAGKPPTPVPPSGGSTPPPASDVAADVKRIRELLELVAKRFGLQ